MQVAGQVLDDLLCPTAHQLNEGIQQEVLFLLGAKLHYLVEARGDGGPDLIVGVLAEALQYGHKALVEMLLAVDHGEALN